jgi:exodeoxyribonuclease-5
MTTFTPHQDSALKAVADWLKAKPGRNGTLPVFRLFGYAGTGKTTLAQHIAEAVDGEVKFAAFTGKAALVMRNKGCDNASTIHSLIYRARESGVEQPSFELWDDAPASKAKLIIIDECSMVDAELGRDLMSFDCPLLVLGDPAQLPPIQGGGFFTDCEPDAMLTEVHRQAQDDPIVRMSMDVREGRDLDIGRYAPIRCWSGATTRAAPTTCGCGRSRTSRIRCRWPATSWSACATIARRACSMAGYGG